MNDLLDARPAVVKRVIVMLASRIPSDLGGSLGVGDLVLLGPGISFDHAVAHVAKVRPLDQGTQAELAGSVASAFDGIEWKAVKGMMLALANDLNAYVLRPTFQVVQEVLAFGRRFPDAEIIVVHANRSSRDVPLVGFVTSESVRGSRNLLGAYIAKMMTDMPALRARVRFVTCNGDWLCEEWLRRTVVRLVDIALWARFVPLLAIIYVRTRKHTSTTGPFEGTTLLVRAFHQARFGAQLAEEIRAGNRSVRFLYVPQFAQARIRDVFGKIIPALGDKPCFVPTLWDIRDALPFVWADRKALLLASKNVASLHLEVAGQLVSLDIRGLAPEFSRLSIFLLYRRLLEAVLRRNNIGRLLGFELVGKVAGMERLAACGGGCELHVIQTAVVSDVPHPVFPLAHVFYADGPASAERLSRIGALRMGEVIYAGANLLIRPLRVPDKIRVLSFFTQPYEHKITCEILDALYEYCEANNALLRIKLHPRDDGGSYKSVLSRPDDVVMVSGPSTNPQEVIEASDVCVMRTSSVAREALAMGRPVVLCLWSEFDRSIRVDYAERAVGADHRAYGKSGLLSLLSDPLALAESARAQRARLFGNQRMSDLVRRACRD